MGDFLSKFSLLAISRHLLSYTAGAATILGAMHLADANGLTAGVSKVADGLAQIAVALGPLTALVSAWWAAHSATPKAQIAAVNEQPNGLKVVENTGLARQLPMATEPTEVQVPAAANKP